MATAKLSVKESLLGSETEPDLSQQSKATFEQHAQVDDDTGDAFMNEEDFISAIAPSTENYVSITRADLGSVLCI